MVRQRIRDAITQGNSNEMFFLNRFQSIAAHHEPHCRSLQFWSTLACSGASWSRVDQKGVAFGVRILLETSPNSSVPLYQIDDERDLGKTTC